MLPVLPPALLALADGTVFHGHSIGATGHTVGEVVFNTALTGYQEILTDPSYCRQIVTLTYPHIGSYGVNDEDLESTRVHAAGLGTGNCLRHIVRRDMAAGSKGGDAAVLRARRAQQPGQAAGVDAGDGDRALALQESIQRCVGTKIGHPQRQVLDHQAGGVDTGRFDVLVVDAVAADVREIGRASCRERVSLVV